MKKQSAVLERAWRRFIVAIIGIVAAVSAATILGTRMLDRQVDHWSRIESINSTREQLLASLQAHSKTPQPDVVLAELNSLDEQASQLSAIGSGDTQQVAEAALNSTTATRSLFLRQMAQTARMERHLKEFRQQVGALRTLTGGWGVALRQERERVSARLEALDVDQADLHARQWELTDSLLKAQNLARKLDAEKRLGTLAEGTISHLPNYTGDLAELPPPCAPGDSTNKATCAVSSSRIFAAFDALHSATVEDRPYKVQLAQRALIAFTRSGQILFENFKSDLQDIHKARISARASQNQLLSLSDKQSRVTRALAQIEDGFHVMESGMLSNVIDRERIDYLFDQVQLRGDELLEAAPQLSSGNTAFPEQVGQLRKEWTIITQILEQREQTLIEFKQQMDVLAGSISENALTIRRTTGLWMDIFASVAITAVVLMLFIVTGILWFGKRSFMEPLNSVTRSLLDLAEGNLDKPLVLPTQAFGFNTLQRAIEKLRRAMIERIALADRNEEQRLEIQRNMRTMELANQEMQWLAMHDPLTGLGNRRKADNAMFELSAQPDQPANDFCLVHVDLDRFKEINDTLGHEAGDFVLRHIAGILKELCRECTEAFRIGGDEFLLVLKAGSREDVEGLAKHIVDAATRPIAFGEHECRLGASLGIAFGRDADFDAQATLVNADLALYEAKGTGRGRYCFFEDQLQTISRHRKNLSDRIRRAIDNGEFMPHYQPQFHTGTLALRGVETLVRWHDPEHGWIPPDQFLNVAEDLKLVGKIDQILFEKAAIDLGILASRGLQIPKISFNVTADRLLRSDLAEDLANAIPPDTRTSIELLESMALDELSDAMRWAIDSLKEKQIGIEIDDFGSCRASISALLAVKPDAMKIDRSIIIPLTHSGGHLQLVKAVVEIGQAMKIEVVAEGVETDEHVTLLQDLGCGVLQGYGLGRPMPVDQLADLLSPPDDTSAQSA